MSDKRTGKKIKRPAALRTPLNEAQPVVVSDLTKHQPMKKKSK